MTTVDEATYLREGFLVFRGLVPELILQTLRRGTSAACWRRSAVPWIDGSPIGRRTPNAIHHPHLVSEVCLAVATDRRLLDIAEPLCSAHLFAPGRGAEMIQTMYYSKFPGSLGQRWHQDVRFVPTSDASLVTAWIAIDSATETNGCLWLAPGTHRDLVLHPHERHPDDEQWVPGEGIPAPDLPVALVMEPGDVAFFSGYLVHGSGPNIGRSSRRSLVVNYQRSSGVTVSNRSCSCGRPIDLCSGSEPSDLCDRVLAR